MSQQSQTTRKIRKCQKVSTRVTPSLKKQNHTIESISQKKKHIETSSEDYLWFYCQWSPSHTPEWLCAIQMLLHRRIISCMEGQITYSMSARACTLDPSPQSCLQLPCSSLCIWQKCWPRNSVMSRWGKKTWETARAPETPCTWCLQYVYSEGRMTSLQFWAGKRTETKDR